MGLVDNFLSRWEVQVGNRAKKDVTVISFFSNKYTLMLKDKQMMPEGWGQYFSVEKWEQSTKTTNSNLNAVVCTEKRKMSLGSVKHHSLKQSRSIHQFHESKANALNASKLKKRKECV